MYIRIYVCVYFDTVETRDNLDMRIYPRENHTLPSKVSGYTKKSWPAHFHITTIHNKNP